MKRRTFLSGLAATGARIALPARAREPSEGPPHALTGFIVSDAHVGWDNKQQPSLEKQRRAMARIMTRFPDLDVFIDSGDAHHNGRHRDEERGQWTELIPGGCGAAPFFYTPGNHEIISGREDRESICCAMGSLNGRPYYSYDLRGVHFVSLPQMVRAVYTTRESLEWLALDLAANRHSTTIIISHNNIRATTGPWEPGYRGVVNSSALLDVFEANPQIAAWMHGHNHNFQVVPKHNMLFVSNGRIGGFDPSRHEDDGPYGLGGVYFKLDAHGLRVRCYSADLDLFLDERGVAQSRGDLERSTSFAADAPAAVSFGYGGMRDGQRMAVHSHFAGAKTAQLRVGGHRAAHFNDDPGINLYMARKGVQDQFMGLSVGVNNERHTWENGRLILHARDPQETVNVSVPRRGFHQHMYYRAAPGRAYAAEAVFESGNEGVRVSARFELHDAEGRQLAVTPLAEWTLDKGRSDCAATAVVPEADAAGTLYAENAGESAVQISLQLDITGMREDVAIDRVTLRLADGCGATERPAIVIDGARYAFEESLGEGQTARKNAQNVYGARAIVEAQVAGSRRVSWLLRQEGIDWQVRNAPVLDRGDHLQVGPMRNTWMAHPAIIVAPIYRGTEPFVHRLERISRARVYPLNRGNDRLRVYVDEAGAEAEVVIVATERPAGVAGGGDWTYAEKRLRISAATGDRIEVSFA